MSVAPTTSQPSALSEKTYCTENAASNFGLSAAGNIRQLHLNSDEFSLHNQVTTPPETRGTAGGDNIREQTNVGGKRTLSQSGEEKRQSYRSSGYGTGSSQGSADKTEVVTNDDVFEDLYSAPNTAGLSQEELTAKLRTNPQFYTLGVDNYNLSLGSTSSGGTLLDSASSFGDDGTLIPRLSILLNNSAVCSASRGNSQNTTQLQSSAEVHRKESSRQHSTTSGHSAMSSREVSFELQSWGAQSDDNESEPSVLPSSESSEASYREAVQQLWKYMTSQKESPNLTPSEDDVVTPPPHQVIPDPKTSLDTNMAHPVAQAEEERFQSVLDSFCSISVPSDQQVPQAVVDRMYRSAVWRIQRDAILKYLDSVKEEDTTSGVFEGLERLTFDSDHPSSSTERTSHKTPFVSLNRLTISNSSEDGRSTAWSTIFSVGRWSLVLRLERFGDQTKSSGNRSLWNAGHPKRGRYATQQAVLLIGVLCVCLAFRTLDFGPTHQIVVVFSWPIRQLRLARKRKKRSTKNYFLHKCRWLHCVWTKRVRMLNVCW